MKDHECRTNLAKFEIKLNNLEDEVNRFRSVFDSYTIVDLNRRFNAVVKELGFSFDDYGVFDNNVVNSGSLWKLQLQLNALIAALGFEEVWTEGVLSYRAIQR